MYNIPIAKEKGNYMSFSDVMQNLAVGIAGGIFSSIIVSVVFYVLNEYQNEINKAKDMIYPLYGIIVLDMTDGVPKDFKTIDVARECFGEVTNNFSRFEPWQFKYELKEAMCKINEIICDGKYYGKNGALSKKALHEFSKEIEDQIDKIEDCEKNFPSGFLKRVFRNKIIIATGIVFFAIVIIA